MTNNKVYIISGPTAVGKSLIAFKLAQKLNGEIINCDSVQLYKYMDIGSAKPSPEIQAAIKHHLYSIVEPSYKMTVAKYRELALAVIDDVLSRGKTPIVCGGTGLYLNSILYDMNFTGKKSDLKRREELTRMAEENGPEYMHHFLMTLSPESAARIHPNNTRKVIRAIEAFEHGNAIGDLSDCKLNDKYDFRFFALSMDREWLYDRINKRVNKLIADGLVDEVISLLEKGVNLKTPAMRAIGYKEIIPFLRGDCDLETAAEEIRKNTRHFAKRQFTWLKRYDFVHWIEINKSDMINDILYKILVQDE